MSNSGSGTGGTAQEPMGSSSSNVLDSGSHPNIRFPCVIEEERSKDLSIGIEDVASGDEDEEKELDLKDLHPTTAAFAAAENNNNENNHNESQANVDMGWSLEQMNSNLAQRSWFRELKDSINQFRYRCGMVVNNNHVQTFIIILIAINAIMMGLATFDFVKNDPVRSQRFEGVDDVFLIIFTVELGLQFFYHGFRLLLDGWLVFDLIIISISWFFASVQIIRSFRIFRALRLVTRIKIMKNLILALLGVIPRMAAIALMLALIFYIFGVMFTQLFKTLYVNGDTTFNYFSDLGWTFFTLFQMMTLDEWASIAREVIKVYKWAWVPFITFVVISGFIVVNLIIAVICDAIGALHAGEKAKLHGHFEEGGSDAGGSQHSMELREQLDKLEDQMEDLTHIQARTYHTLQYLTQQLQMRKVKQELKSKTSGNEFAETMKKLKSVRTKGIEAIAVAKKEESDAVLSRTAKEHPNDDKGERQALASPPSDANNAESTDTVDAC